MRTGVQQLKDATPNGAFGTTLPLAATVSDNAGDVQGQPGGGQAGSGGAANWASRVPPRDVLAELNLRL